MFVVAVVAVVAVVMVVMVVLHIIAVEHLRSRIIERRSQLHHMCMFKVAVITPTRRSRGVARSRQRSRRHIPIPPPQHPFLPQHLPMMFQIRRRTRRRYSARL